MALDRPQLTPDQQAQNALATALDSVNLVNELVTANVHSEQVDNRVDANYRHLEIVLARENVQNYLANNTVDITALTNAIAAGKTFLGR